MLTMPIQQVLDTIEEPGGFVTADCRTSVDWLAGILRRRLVVTSRPGGGLIFVLKELIVQVLASRRPVRVLDYGGSFRDLCHSLDGLYLESWHPDVWMDPRYGMVVMDLRLVSPHDWPGVLDDIARTPPSLWVLTAEWLVYGNNCPRADALASMDLATSDVQQIEADITLYGGIRKDRQPVGLTDRDRDFLSPAPDRFTTRWVLVDGESHHHFLMTAGPKRAELFG